MRPTQRTDLVTEVFIGVYNLIRHSRQLWWVSSHPGVVLPTLSRMDHRTAREYPLKVFMNSWMTKGVNDVFSVVTVVFRPKRH